MDKAQIAALALATALGATGGAVAVKAAAGTSASEYRVHAMDLRLSPAGEITAEVWADKKQPDGKWKDQGRGNKCMLAPGYDAVERDLLKAAESCVKE